MLHSVIMAGGSGTRFWPLSRKEMPKQFLTLSGNRSLIQQAFDRCQPLVPADQCWVVTGARLAKLTEQHLPEIPSQHILLEPAARNTAACIGLASISLLAVDRDATMVALPADQIVTDVKAFQKDLCFAEQLIDEAPQRLVLFGVPPTYPATEFGYIERSHRLKDSAYQVAAFHEKPDRNTAERYLKSGTFSWNCGIFVWKAQRILDALATYEPELARGLHELARHLGKASWPDALNEIFPTLKSLSIDYAVLEREANIVVVEASFPWDDVGGWEAASRLVPANQNLNHIVGDAIVVDGQNCIVHSNPNHVISIQGLSDIIVVQAGDATYVAKRGDGNAIRKIVAALEEQGFEHYL